ncbi:hypothetical protein ACVIGB_010027 [Bradyrhizobium sp. USDA 4341]
MTETRDFPTIVIASLSSGVLLCKFEEIHDAAEFLMGHPICTHHFGSRDIWKEMQRTVLEQCPGMPTDAAPGIDATNYVGFVVKLEAEIGKAVKIRKGDGLTAMLPTDGIPERLNGRTIIVEVPSQRS